MDVLFSQLRWANGLPGVDIVEWAPLWISGRNKLINLPLQQVTWSGVMSISSAIHIRWVIGVIFYGVVMMSMVSLQVSGLWIGPNKNPMESFFQHTIWLWILMKSWVDCLSLQTSGLWVICRGHGEIDQCLMKILVEERHLFSLDDKTNPLHSMKHRSLH